MGEDWRDKIRSTLEEAAFFIPVLTPRYFMSPECRAELNLYLRAAKSLGVEDLILPLLYVDVPGLQLEAETDELVALVKRFQWEDWRDLRFKSRKSEAYRRAVVRLAERIVEVNKRLEQRPDAAPVPPMPEAGSGPSDEALGFLDRLAEVEEKLPLLSEPLETMTEDMQEIGDLVTAATVEIKRADKQAPGFAARLLIARKMSRQLAEPVERISVSTNKYVSLLHEIDEGVGILVELAADEARKSLTAKTQACALFNAIRALSSQTHTGLAAVQRMIEATEPIEKMSKDLRPVFRRLREGLTRMLEARSVGDDWVRRIDASGLRCEDVEDD